MRACSVTLLGHGGPVVSRWGNRAHARRPGVEAPGGGEEDGDGWVAQVR
jgi:hypothetical protein